MRSLSKLLVFGMISIALNACVTTREQLNEEKGIGTKTPTDNGAPTRGDVKSEDLTPKVAEQPAPAPSSITDPGTSTASGASVAPPTAVAPVASVAPPTAVAPIAPVAQVDPVAPIAPVAPVTPVTSETNVPAANHTTAMENKNLENGIASPMTTTSGATTAGATAPVTAPMTADVASTTQATTDAANLGATTATGNGVASGVTAPGATGAGTTGAIIPPIVVAVPATPTPNPDLSSYSAEELRSEVANLSGKLEENQHNQQLTDQAHLEESKKAQARIDELEKKLKELQPDAPVVPQGKTPFEAGKDDVLSNNCDEAIVFFTQSLTASDVGKEAEEATYLRGECYFKKSQFNKAIVDFSHFPEKYQKSSFHPKALLRIAESFEAMGRKDDAKAFYSDLLDKFPKTAEGKLAKKRLKAKA